MFFFKRRPLEDESFYGSYDVQQAIHDLVQFGNLDSREREQSELPKSLMNVWFGSVADELVRHYQRCAICEETRKDISAYRFRPSFNVEPADSRASREYYFWLSLSEENLYPICPSCHPDAPHYFPIRRGDRVRPTPAMFKVAQLALQTYEPRSKNDMTVVFRDITRLFFAGDDVEEILSQNYDEKAVKKLGEMHGVDFTSLTSLSEYSMRRNEKQLFYEPGHIRDPARYFSVGLDGVFSPLTPLNQDSTLTRQNRAAATLAHFNLNAPEKVRRRAVVLEEYLERFLSSAKSGFASHNPLLFSFQTVDFASAWYLLLRDIGTVWASRTVEQVQPNFSMRDLPRTYAKLMKTGTDHIVERIVEELRNGEVMPSSVFDAREAEQSITPPVIEARIRRPERPKLNATENSNISSVSIRNYKALEALNIDLPQQPEIMEKARKSGETGIVSAILMLGENACGKSSILEAIALATVDSNAFAALDVDLRKLVLNPRYMGLRGEGGAENGVIQEERKCEITVELTSGKTYRTRFSRSESIRRDVSADGEAWRPIGPEDGLNIFAFGAHRLFGADTRNSGAAANVCTLFDNAQLLTDPEAWLIELHDKDPEALDEVVARLRDLISIDGVFRSIEVVPDPDRPDRRTCEMRIVKDLPDTTGQTKEYVVHMPLSAVSSGYRTIIALFCDIISGLLADLPDTELNYRVIREALDAPCTVMIDEIEAHLHPRWKMQVVEGLRKVLKNAYFILTSHDPLCIRGMANEEVFVLNRGTNAETKSETDVLERVDFEPGDIKTELFTVEQLLTSNLFNLLTTENHKREIYWAEQIEQGGGRSDFEEEVANALPIGDSVVTRLVQEAVWEYLKETKDQVQNPEARKTAIEKIKAHLKQASF